MQKSPPDCTTKYSQNVPEEALPGIVAGSATVAEAAAAARGKENEAAAVPFHVTDSEVQYWEEVDQEQLIEEESDGGGDGPRQRRKPQRESLRWDLRT